MDTIINKVDAKGRVSLPSDYRAIVKELSTEIGLLPQSYLSLH